MPARVFLIRHGETDWSLGGKHNSTTDIPMSTTGEKQVERTREVFVGEGRAIDPKNVSRIYCSSRDRTRRTAEILRLGVQHHQYFHDRGTGETTSTSKLQAMGEMAESAIQVTPSLEEWDYGEYEGMTLGDVARVREQTGQDGQKWNIWRDGCPGGETPQQVSDRVDALIKEIKGVMEGTAATWPGGKTVPHVAQEPRDVVCIAHGHILATFALRWLGRTLDQGTRILFEPAGVAILGFELDDLEAPALLLGRRSQI